MLEKGNDIPKVEAVVLILPHQQVVHVSAIHGLVHKGNPCPNPRQMSLKTRYLHNLQILFYALLEQVLVYREYNTISVKKY